MAETCCANNSILLCGTLLIKLSGAQLMRVSWPQLLGSPVGDTKCVTVVLFDGEGESVAKIG